MNFEQLPEDCIGHILSLVSSADVCRSAVVSSAIRSVANSDDLREKFLPFDHQEILSRLKFPLRFSSQKELFFQLCNPLLIDDGRKSFSINKFTGKTSIMLCARELTIIWASVPLCWSWKFIPQSRFDEVAELVSIWWLEIKGKMSTKMLSQQTVYTVCLFVKITRRAYGLDTLPSEVSVEIGDYISRGNVFLHREQNFERKDGWMEIELGSFYNNGGDEELKFCLKEVKGEHLKGGVIVEGVEIRPKKM